MPVLSSVPRPWKLSINNTALVLLGTFREINNPLNIKTNTVFENIARISPSKFKLVISQNNKTFLNTANMTTL